jgi:hypothetical protein
MGWTGHIALTREKKNACIVLLGSPEGKRKLGRHRRRQEDNVQLYLKETRWGGTNWTDLAQDKDQWRAFVNTVMNLRIP